jgi:hypothetical protein
MFADDFGAIVTLEQEQRIEPTMDDKEIPNTANRMFYPEELKSKKLTDIEQREAEYTAKEQDINFQTAKETWKNENPELTIKHFKELYTKGLIDSLPWEQPAEPDNYNVSKGYQQNAEQSDSTLFNKLSKK